MLPDIFWRLAPGWLAGWADEGFPTDERSPLPRFLTRALHWAWWHKWNAFRSWLTAGFERRTCRVNVVLWELNKESLLPGTLTPYLEGSCVKDAQECGTCYCGRILCPEVQPITTACRTGEITLVPAADADEKTRAKKLAEIAGAKSILLLTGHFVPAADILREAGWKVFAVDDDRDLCASLWVSPPPVAYIGPAHLKSRILALGGDVWECDANRCASISFGSGYVQCSDWLDAVLDVLIPLGSLAY